MANKTKTKTISKVETRGGLNNASGKGLPTVELATLDNDDTKRDLIGKVVKNVLAFGGAFTMQPKSDDELIERLDFFFQKCGETNQIPTIEKMCVCLGMHRDSVFDVINGTSYIGPNSGDILKKAKELIAGIDAELALDSKIQPVVYLFRAKNYYGMRDQQELVVTPKGNDVQDEATIAAKYKELPDND